MPLSTTLVAAHWLLAVAAAYAVIGVAVAAVFVLFGVTRALGAARVSLGARILILPAAAALWPLVLRRWREGAA